MSNHVRHFVLTGDGRIREFSPEQAARVAAGAGRMPEFADSSVRYLQLTLDDETETEIRIQSAGACIRFDAEGKLLEAGPATVEEQISGFEHDAVVQWVLRDRPQVGPTFH
jgi:hypothetical protein